MKLVYAPDGEDRQEWEFDLDNLTGDQLILLEDSLDLTFGEWSKLLDRGSLKAMLALCWLLRRESEPDLSWSDAKSVKIGALSVEKDDDEAPKAPEPSSSDASETSTEI